MWRSQGLVVLLVAGALGAENFTCPEDEITGKFVDPTRCDRYWDCFKGTPTLESCDDGLAFDPARVHLANPCDYLHNVDCRGRGELGQPRGEGVCDRMNGVYEHEDPNVCEEYYICEGNNARKFRCSPGLHFHPVTKLCVWPAEAKRGSCGARLSLNGFTCDGKDYFTASGQKIAHPRFAHQDDCTKFYVCKGGVTPSISGCDEGKVFNDVSKMCDVPENVPECDPNNQDYLYEDYPEDEDTGTPL